MSESEAVEVIDISSVKSVCNISIAIIIDLYILINLVRNVLIYLILYVLGVARYIHTGNFPPECQHLEGGIHISEYVQSPVYLRRWWG